MRKRTVASLSKATGAGKSAKVMARTTTLSAGEANMAARTDSVLIPEAYSPRAIGAMQFVHTASATAADRRKKSKRGRTKKERKGHTNAVGVEPIDGSAPDPGGERHGAIHPVNSPKGESASGLDLRAGVVALEQSRVARIHPENTSDGDHQNDGERAAAPRVGGDDGRLQVESRSLNGHERPPRRQSGWRIAGIPRTLQGLRR